MLSAEVGPLAWPVLSLVSRAALVDPEAAALRDEIDAGRARRMSRNVAHLAHEHLRAGMTRAHILLAYSTELYEPLVVRAGWSPRTTASTSSGPWSPPSWTDEAAPNEGGVCREGEFPAYAAARGCPGSCRDTCGARGATASRRSSQSSGVASRTG